MKLSICWKKNIIRIPLAGNVLDSKFTAKMPPVPYIIFQVYLSALQYLFVVALFYTLQVELPNCKYLRQMK